MVGSSRKISSGSPTSARARSSRRRWPPESCLARTSALLGQLDQLDHLVHLAAPDVVAAVHLDQLGHGQVALHAALLQDDAHLLAQLAGARGRVEAEHPSLAAGPGPVALEDLDGGGLARPVGAEQAEDLAPPRPRSSRRAPPRHRRRTCAGRVTSMASSVACASSCIHGRAAYVCERPGVSGARRKSAVTYVTPAQDPRLDAPALEHLVSRSWPSTADPGRGQLEPGSGAHLHLEPAGGQHPQDVPVGEGQAVSLATSPKRSSTRSTRAPTSAGRLAVRAAVPPQVPVRVAARGSQAWSAPRSDRSPTRTGRDRARPRSAKPASSHVSRARCSGTASARARTASSAKRSRSAAAPRAPRFGQRQVGARGVPAGQAPLGLAVADDEDALGHRQAQLGGSTGNSMSPSGALDLLHLGPAAHVTLLVGELRRAGRR